MSTSDASSRYEDEGARSRASTDELVDDIRHDINEQIYQVSVWRVSTVLLLLLPVLSLLSQYYIPIAASTSISVPSVSDLSTNHIFSSLLLLLCI